MVLLRRRTYSGTDIVGSSVRPEVFGFDVRLCVRSLILAEYKTLPASQLLNASGKQPVYVTCCADDDVVAREEGAYHRSHEHKLFQHRPPPRTRFICARGVMKCGMRSSVHSSETAKDKTLSVLHETYLDQFTIAFMEPCLSIYA
jgi:hypothetical protein